MVEIWLNREIAESFNIIKQGIAPAGYQRVEIGIIPIQWSIKRFKKCFR